MKQLRNLQLLKKQILKPVIGLFVVIIAFGLVTNHFEYVSSALLGTWFSYLIFQNMIDAQTQLLNSRTIRYIFVHFIKRLLFVAAPVVLTLKYPQFLFLPVVLISLFSFQGFFIIINVFQQFKKLR